MEPKPPTHEKILTPENAWLFDVDGVITNPTEKTVTEPEILDKIIKRLLIREPIGLNTGRSIDFVCEQVLKPLEDRIEDKRILDGIIAIGEKGGAWITYVNGERIEEIDEDIKVPEDLQEAVKSLIESEFWETMFYDETKKTMISTEMKKGMNLDAYHEEQKILTELFKKLLEKRGLLELKIDPTTIATDIENRHVGKALGSKKFLEILKDRNVNPANITAFGDSSSDFDMLDPLRESGIPTVFVFVGKDTSREDIVRTNEHYDKGTLEYLKAQDNDE